MAKATTTTYLEIESIGADKLITTMAGLQKSLNFVAGMLKDLNKGLGLSSTSARKGAEAMYAQAKAAGAAEQNAEQLRVAMAQQMVATDSLAESVKKLTESQKEQEKSLDWTALASKVQIARQAYDTIKSTLSSLGQEALRVSQAWEKQEKAELLLQSALKDSPAQGEIAKYKEWASAIQSATTFGDEQVLSLSAVAARFTSTEKETQKATKAALDYASATGGDAQDALKNMGRALGGTSDSLRQLGIYLSESEKAQYKSATEAERLDMIVGKLTENYGGFSEVLATTPTGALQQAQNILSDIDEQVGRLVSPALYAGLGVVKDFLQEQLKAIDSITTAAGGVTDIQRTILAGLATAGGVIIDIKTGILAIYNAVEIVTKSIMAVFTAAFKEWGELFNFIGKIEILPDSLQKTLTRAGEALTRPFDFAVQGIKSDIGDIKAAINSAATEKDALWKSAEKSYLAYQSTIRSAGGKPATANDGGGISPAQATKGKAKEEVDSGFEVQLDSDFQSLMDFYSKSEAAAADFSAKRAAIEQSAIIDYESKLEYKASLDKQEQEALRALKLEYARATGDELAIIEDTYRQDRLAKEAAAAQALAETQKATMQALAGNLKSVGGLGLDMLTSWIEGTGDWREQLFDALKSFSKNLMATSLASIIDQALVNQAKAQGSQAGIPVVGPALALASGIAMFATTMALKSKLKPVDVQYANGGFISAGMVRGGAVGRDSVAALLAPGERVLSAKEAEEYDRKKTAFPAQNIVINVNVSGQLSSPAQVTDTVRRVLIPEIRNAVKAGYALG